MAKKKPELKTAGQRGVIYARYSSHAQRDCSIEQQVEAAQAFAKTQGISVSKIYADRAVSGKSDKRPEFQKMLKDAEKGEFAFVIAWKSNRIGRNMLQAMINEERLRELDVKCVYVEEDFDDSAAGRFALRSMMNVNQFYIENMAEDIARGLMDSAKQCFALGKMLYGYKKGPDKRYEIDEPTAAVVKEIFTRVANGEPHIEIVEDLNRRGIKSPNGGMWMRTSFQRMIRNNRYTGIYRYRTIEIPGGMPQIVSNELFCRAQEELMNKPNPRENTRRRTKNGLYLLTGKLFCGKCGETMTGISGTGKHGELHFYYVCNGKRLNHSCTKKNVQRDRIEQAVGRAIKEYAMTDDVLSWIGDMAIAWCQRQEEDSDIHILEDQLTETNRALANMMKAIEMGVITETTTARLKELESEKKRLDAQVEIAKKSIIVTTKEEIVAGMKMFRDGNVEDKKYLRTLIDTFVKAVYVYDDDLKVVFSFTEESSAVTVPLDDLRGDEGEKFVLTPHQAICYTLNELVCIKATKNGLFILVVKDYLRT